MDKEQLIDRIQNLCKQKGVKPTIACMESGAGRNLIGDIRNGKSPSIERLIQLANYLDMSVSDLIGDKKEPATQQGDELSEKFKLLYAGLTDAQKDILVRTMKEMQGNQ